MFATSIRGRRHEGVQRSGRGIQDTVEPPPPGSDSCFGVRSLNNSVEWIGEGTAEQIDVSQGDTQEDEVNNQVEDPAGDREEGEVKEVDEEVSPTSEAVAQAITEDISTPNPTTEGAQTISLPTQDAVETDLRDIEGNLTIRQSRTYVPTPVRIPSPALFLPVLSTSASPSNPHSPSSRSDFDSPPAISDYSTDEDQDQDQDHSAPPSPTSQNSFPSYLASEISMSMPSSPGMGYSTDPGSITGDKPREGTLRAALERERARSGGKVDDEEDEDGEEEVPDLVIPMLSLPSSSLHLSLRPYGGQVEGLKIALVGDMATSRAFLRALGESEELVDIGKRRGGGIGIIRDGRLQAVIITGLTVSQIRQKVLSSYTNLNSLLNPAADRGDQTRLREMIARYADREEWIHAYLTLNDEDDAAISTLAHLLNGLPRSVEFDSEERNATDLNLPSVPSNSPTMSNRMDDPTPLARVESSSYFSHPISDPTLTPISPIPETPLSPTIHPLSTIRTLTMALESSSEIVSASVDRFLSWRPASLDSSNESLGTASAETASSGPTGLTEGDVQPMPTVVRAQGGGEWEAGLSRRVAKRRESGAAIIAGAASGKAAEERGGARRRRSKGMKDAPAGSTSRSTADAPPLFPPVARRSRGSESESGPISPGGSISGSSLINLGLGAKDLLERAFGPLRDGMRGWKRVLVVATIVGVMGWGWWASSSAASR